MTFSYKVDYPPTPEFVDSWVGSVGAEERKGARHKPSDSVKALEMFLKK